MPPRAILCIIIVAVVIIVFSSLCSPAPTPSAHLARATREAVGLARDAVARQSSFDVLRLLAIVVGVCIPLIVAYLIWRSSATSEIDATEILDAIERFELPSAPERTIADLPKPSQTAVTPRNPDQD